MDREPDLQLEIRLKEDGTSGGKVWMDALDDERALLLLDRATTLIEGHRAMIQQRR